MNAVVLRKKILYQTASILNCSLDVSANCSLASHSASRSVRWIPPDQDSWKLNCDGSVTNFGEVASVGGVLRNHLGGFIFGFASHIGKCSIVDAELHAILVGIRLIILHGFIKVIIESDSLLSVRFVNVGCSSLHPSYNLVKEIQESLPRDGSVSVVHALREANQVADSFAKFGLSLPCCSRFFSVLPRFAVVPHRADMARTIFPRGYN